MIPCLHSVQVAVRKVLRLLIRSPKRKLMDSASSLRVLHSSRVGRAVAIAAEVSRERRKLERGAAGSLVSHLRPKRP